MSDFALKQADYAIFVVATIVAFWLLRWALTRWREWASLPRITWLIMSAVLLAGWWPVQQSGEAERRQIEQLVSALAPTYAQELARSGHALLALDTADDHPLLASIRRALEDWNRNNAMASDIYTMRIRPDGTQVFVVDADTDYDGDGIIDDNERAAAPGEVYDHPEVGLKKALAGEANFDPKVVHDRWGSWVTAWAPIPGPDGKPEAAVGIDYDARIWNRDIGAARRDRISEIALLLLTIGASMSAIGILQGQMLLRRKAQEEHLRAERRLRLTFEQLPLACLEINTGGIIESWNPAAEEIFGYTRDDVVGKMHLDVLVAPVSRAAVHEIWNTLITDSVSRRNVADNVTRDGRIIRCEWFSSQVLGPAGEVVAIMCLGQDVSERVSLEEQVRQAQRMTAIGQLAAGVAHDFNNLLTVIQGHTHLLLDRSDLAEDAREDVDRIGAASDRAANLTRQLLTFSRKQAMFARPLNLNDMVANTKHLLERTLGADIALETRLEAELPLVEADPTMIDQVLTNLAVNARDAMPSGGALTFATKLIDVAVDEARVHAERRAGRFVRLSVSDTGTGISPDVLPRIFEPFFTTKEVGKGTGLGLSAVHGVVKQHGGWIEVNSEPGFGSTFHVFFPPTDKKIDTQRRAPAERKTERRDVAVLLVEDERSVRALARTALERGGVRVYEAEDGPAAERTWSEHKQEINALVTDMVMPNGISGRELAERLCAERPELPIVFASGYTMETTAPGFAETPTQTFIQKPYVPKQLLSALDRVLHASSGPDSGRSHGSKK